MYESIRDFSKNISAMHSNWDEELRNAGYYSSALREVKEWTNVHVWCKEKFGEKHYTWTGSTFWFETEQDAILFALRWS